MGEPTTCFYCDALITEDRDGEMVKVPSETKPVWVHPDCRSREPYSPQGNALFAYLALDEQYNPDAEGWELLRNLESFRGKWPGSDAVDFEDGLHELAEKGWAEADETGTKYRLTPQGRMLKKRVGR